MANKIQVKRSAVPSKVPTTSDLDLGEIAINTYDGRVFLHVSNSAKNTIEHIVTTNSIKLLFSSKLKKQNDWQVQSIAQKFATIFKFDCFSEFANRVLQSDR